MQIIIDGAAVPQGRPRAVRMGAGVRMYDPPKSKAYKEMVTLLSRSHMSRNQIETITAPIIVTMTFCFKPPKSYSKKRIQAIETKQELFNKKPDIDNLAKSVLDGMNGTVFKDDAQIVELNIKKQYDKADCVVVEIKEAIEIIEGSH